MSLFTHITVFAHERALEYVDGVCTRALEPGRYRAAVVRRTSASTSGSGSSRPPRRRC